MPVDLIIIGAGGTAREILAWIEELGDHAPRYRCVGLLDDDPALERTLVGGVPVVGPVDTASRWPHVQFVDALGGPGSFHTRPAAIDRFGAPDDRYATMVHPAAYVSPRSTIGRGTVIFPHATIGAHVTLGRHAIVLPGAVINHDTHIGEFTIVTSGASIAGGVTIGPTCYVGMASAIIQGTTVGPGALIGMGAMVRHDVPAGSVVAGNPARVLHTAPDRA